MKRLATITAACIVFAAGISWAPATAQVGAGRVLVRFEKAVGSADRLQDLSLLNARKIGQVYGDDVWVVSSTTNAPDLAAKLGRLPSVVYAEPDLQLHVDVTAPNDPRFADQYALQRINAVSGWTAYPGAYTSSGGPTIAVIDTGIDTNHEDLVGRIDTANSRCFGLLCFLTGYEDDNGHGTHTAGTAAAATNNAKGVAGVAFNSRIMALKVCNAGGTCNTADIVSAINWARDRGAKVISMSLGGGGSTTLQTAVANAHNAGVVLVASAGNDGNATLNYPAAYTQVISVAATDSNDNRASFSNANADVELAAPGVNVLAPYNNGGYTSLSGTSMSAPHVSGLAALLRGQNPTWTNTQVRNRMNACSDDLGAAGRDNSFGNGRINVGRALGTC